MKSNFDLKSGQWLNVSIHSSRRATRALVALLFASLLIACGKSDAETEPAKSLSISPTSGSIGSLVTLTAENFDLSSTSSITVNGTAAIILSKSSSSAQLFVMPGTTSGTITATASAGSLTSTSAFTVSTAAAIATQQGTKLVGTGNSGAARQGSGLAISADGNTALSGGYLDNTNQGALWAYTRSGSTWTQQGTRLVGTGNVGAAQQARSAALSADGNTALIGARTDDGNNGAAWVFTRNGSTWTQQGTKLVANGNSGLAQLGCGVALSADGNTALVGGCNDNSSIGAAWVYVRNGSTWSQQGSKLVGSGNSGVASQGLDVALSADGNTAIIGGQVDNGGVGAAWVFTRSNGTWTQQGAKLVGTGYTGTTPYQGTSVALSADGNTAMIGGIGDNTNQGAVWVFVRSGGTWTQQGSKLVAAGNTGAARLGIDVSLSADGNTAIAGGYQDNSNAGATWVFTRSGTTWTQSGTKLVGTGSVGSAFQGGSVALSSDGRTALVGGYSDNSDQGAAWVFVP